MDEVLSSELQAVEAIYCLPGECIVTDFPGSKQLEVKLKTHSGGKKLDLAVVFQLEQLYPNVLPDMSFISVSLPREAVHDLKQSTMQFAAQLAGQQMLLQILSFIQEKLDSLRLNDKLPNSKPAIMEGKIWTMILQLDHMRAKTKYVKTIEKWTSELSLTGRLIFMGRLILILIQGDKDSLKKYIHRHKSENVDIDSHGRSCKEKMMKILCEEKCKKRFSQFYTLTCSSELEFQSIYSDCEMNDIYDKYIKPMQGLYF